MATADLSARTVRRVIASGAIPSYRTASAGGSWFPFGAIDRFIQDRRKPTMAIAPNPASPHRSVDARGRALPMTEEEIRLRNEGAIRALDSLDEIGDEEEQRATLAALRAAIDEEPLSDRKRFR